MTSSRVCQKLDHNINNINNSILKCLGMSFRDWWMIDLSSNLHHYFHFIVRPSKVEQHIMVNGV